MPKHNEKPATAVISNDVETKGNLEHPRESYAGDFAAAPEIESEDFDASDNQMTAESDEPPPKPKWRKRFLIYGLPLLLILLVAVYFLRPKEAIAVTLAAPVEKTITEAIASSGRVGAAIETNVGAQTSGIVGQIFVEEGSRVNAGQRLAVLKNDVTSAQFDQSRATLDRARAEYAEIVRPALNSDVAAAAGQVRQAQAQAAQQRANVTQNERAVARQQAALKQRQAEKDLAAKELTRVAALVQSGDYSRSQYDTAEKELRVAEGRVTEAQKAIEEAQAVLNSARAAVNSAEANVGVLRARQQTTQIRNSPQQIEVARLKISEAEQSLRVAEKQAGNAEIVAPFAGTVTKINAEPGQTPGANGVLSLVSDVTEIRLNVDESNLADLKTGQEAVVSSNAFPGSAFRAAVSEIAPSVNEERGTIEITLTPVNPPEWLRPGQTVNVNIVTNKAVRRLIIPQTALARIEERNVVYVVENGRAAEKQVITRPATGEGVPVASGLDITDWIIINAQGVKAGDAVTIE